jgi:glyoxylase-like metal-dependent hydrolase (beta-lactamase superfamily II)
MGREGVGGGLFRGALFLLETFFVRYEPARVDIRCTGGELIDCFGGIRVIASPGHSPGSLSYYHPARGILFAGDALSGVPGLKLPPRLGCADYHEALTTAKKLSEIVAATALCGELSLMAAILGKHWVSSHEQYGRNF